MFTILAQYDTLPLSCLHSTKYNSRQDHFLAITNFLSPSLSWLISIWRTLEYNCSFNWWKIINLAKVLVEKSEWIQRVILFLWSWDSRCLMRFNRSLVTLLENILIKMKLFHCSVNLLRFEFVIFCCGLSWIFKSVRVIYYSMALCRLAKLKCHLCHYLCWSHYICICEGLVKHPARMVVLGSFSFNDLFYIITLAWRDGVKQWHLPLCVLL